MKINDFLSQLCEHSGIDLKTTKIEVIEEDEKILIQLDIAQEDSGLVIGSKGEVLTAIQRILRLIFSEKYEGKKIIFNVNDYQQKRKETLESMATEAAQQVLVTGRPYTIQSFLPAYERYLIHSYISENPDFSNLESLSVGEGGSRRVVIKKKEEEVIFEEEIRE